MVSPKHCQLKWFYDKTYNFRQIFVCDICWNGHCRHFYWDSAYCTLHISNHRSSSGSTQHVPECWISCWKCCHRANSASSHQPASPSAHRWHRPTLEGMMSGHDIWDLFHRPDFTDRISQKGGVGLCCLILCIFIAFLVFVTIPQMSQEVPTVSTCFASIWFLTSPLFALS